MAYEDAGVHHAQEFENRFWTVFGMMTSAALFFAHDSPLASISLSSPSLGVLAVILSGYIMHVWDRWAHRQAISQQHATGSLRRNTTAGASLLSLREMGIPVEEQLQKINSCLKDIDQLLIPSTINNFINRRFVLNKEREIIKAFEDCDARALNWLIGHVKLGLLFYKVKDHASFNGKHRTELINLLAVERLSILTVVSRVIVLHSLQLLKLQANPRAEYWVRNIILNTVGEALSELKTLTDAKGDYFCMNKLIYDDIRSETVRQDILSHIRREAAVQQTHRQMIGSGSPNTHKRKRLITQWRKVLSDVDDTLYCSGGMYPAGVDRRFPKKTVYPGVLAFYRELDLGTNGEEEWKDGSVGNLVFLSARPHLYKDISEKANFAKFEKLRTKRKGERKGLHTIPSLLPGDLASGSSYLVRNDFGPLAKKKFENFRQYASIYPEYQHVFVCDNGQGDVKAGEMMFDSFPYEFEALYVHNVMDLSKTYGWDPMRWQLKEFKPCFFKTYPEAALHAATRDPPLIRISGLKRVCDEAVQDFLEIENWPSESSKIPRRMELNQAIWEANKLLYASGFEETQLVPAEQKFLIGQKVRTPYGIARVKKFDPYFDLYEVVLDWRPLDMQVETHQREMKKDLIKPKIPQSPSVRLGTAAALETVVEDTTEDDAEIAERDEPEDVEVSQHTNLLENNFEIGDIASDSSDSSSRWETLQTGGESSAESGPRATTPVHSGMGGTVLSTLVSQATPSIVLGNPSLIMSSNNESPPPVPQLPERSASMPIKLPSEKGNNLLNFVGGSFETEPVESAPFDEFENHDDDKTCSMMVSATISGKFVTKYTPPVLPTFSTNISDKSRGIFTFFTPDSPRSQAPVLKEGDQCTTPYGPGRVVAVDRKRQLVRVKMITWRAYGSIRMDDVKPVPKTLFSSFLRPFGVSEENQKVEFPHAEGTVIRTPFGKGHVVRPIPVHIARMETDRRATRPFTLGIQLRDWKLSNGSSPMLYCTVEQARKWREGKGDDISFFSTIENIMNSSRTLLHPFLPKQRQEIVKKPMFEQYFRDGAWVSTVYGDGQVKQFRASDGIYEVELVKWILANRKYARCFLRRDDMRNLVAKDCQEGYPVLTSFGLSGVLASVEPRTGTHIVTIPLAGMVCYLRPESIVRPLKAAVGEAVYTPYGEGKVLKYNSQRDTYIIELSYGVLYAKAATFDRVKDGLSDKKSFGVDWLLNLFFLSTPSNASQRSRSNSVASVGSVSIN